VLLLRYWREVTIWFFLSLVPVAHGMTWQSRMFQTIWEGKIYAGTAMVPLRPELSGIRDTCICAPSTKSTYAAWYIGSCPGVWCY